MKKLSIVFEEVNDKGEFEVYVDGHGIDIKKLIELPAAKRSYVEFWCCYMFTVTCETLIEKNNIFKPSKGESH